MVTSPGKKRLARSALRAAATHEWRQEWHHRPTGICTGAGEDNGIAKIYDTVGEYQSLSYHERSHYLHPHP
jgi:hypothetical protein